MARNYRDPTSYETLAAEWPNLRSHIRGWASGAPAANTTVRKYGIEGVEWGTFCYALRFSHTDLFTLYPAGWGVLHVGSGTTTTRERLKRFLPAHIDLWQSKGLWQIALDAVNPYIVLDTPKVLPMFLPPAGLTLTAAAFQLILAGAPLWAIADALDDAGACDRLTAEMRAVSGLKV